MNLLTKSSQRVPYYTINRLMIPRGIPILDILHIDVQGGELLVLGGAFFNLQMGEIDYVLVGTHAKNLHRRVKDMLAPTHDVIAEALPGQINRIDDSLPPVWIEKGQDGLILFKRKGL